MNTPFSRLLGLALIFVGAAAAFPADSALKTLVYPAMAAEWSPAPDTSLVFSTRVVEVMNRQWRMSKPSHQLEPVREGTNFQLKAELDWENPERGGKLLFGRDLSLIGGNRLVATEDWKFEGEAPDTFVMLYVMMPAAQAEPAEIELAGAAPGETLRLPALRDWFVPPGSPPVIYFSSGTSILATGVKLTGINGGSLRLEFPQAVQLNPSVITNSRGERELHLRFRLSAPDAPLTSGSAGWVAVWEN